MVVHVDDILLFGEESLVNAVVDVLKQQLKVKPVALLEKPGDTCGYLGRLIHRVVGGFKMEANPKIIQSLIADLEVADARAVKTPSVRYGAQQLTAAVELPPGDIFHFRSALGRLQYVAHDRPDVQFAAHQIASAGAHPTNVGVWRLRRVAKYLRGRPRLTWTFVEGEVPSRLTVTVDADWAGNPKDRRSVSGGLLMLGGSVLVSWARGQRSPALSSAESEYYAIATGIQEARYVQSIGEEMSLSFEVQVRTDSSSAKAASEKVGALHMKHMQLRYFFVKSLVEQGLVSVIKIPTASNPADMLTKSVPEATLCRCLDELPMLRFGEKEEEPSP